MAGRVEETEDGVLVHFFSFSLFFFFSFFLFSFFLF